MLFDVQAALAEILASPDPGAKRAKQGAAFSTFSTISTPQGVNAEIPLPAKGRPFTPRPSADSLPSRDDGDAFRHGRAAGEKRPQTWTGRIVSLDEWRKLSAWDRHGQDGRLWCGICRAWVSSFPDCHGGAA